MHGAMGLIGYGIENGDLVKGIGGGFPTRSVHAYIPMAIMPGGVVYVEDEPVAYLNRTRAKRIADAARRRHKRRNPKSHVSYIVYDITIK